MTIFRYFTEGRKLTRINKMSGIIFLFCFVFIFPMIQSNIIQKSPYAPRCYTDIPSGIYLIECIDVNVNNLTTLIEEEIKNSHIGNSNISTLRVRNLSVESGKLSQNWINTTSFRIRRLEIYSAQIERIDNKAFTGYAFENLVHLVLNNMKVDTIEEGTFEGLQSLSVLDFTGLEVNHIKENALKAVASNLVLLFVSFMVLPLNPTNLTGSVPLPQISSISFAFNSMANVEPEFFTQISEIKTMTLDYNEIEHIGCGTFQRMTSLTRLWLNSNRLTSLDSCVFGDEIISNLQPYTLNLGYNKWNCTCDLDWLKQLKVNNKVMDDPKCASHSDKPFEEVNFCEERHN